MSKELGALNFPGFVDAIDVSQVQQFGDVNLIAQSGFKAAFVKVAESVGAVDPRGKDTLNRLRDAGLYVGVYSFARVEHGGAERHAQHLYDSYGETFVSRMFLDLERAPANYSAAQLCDFAEQFFEKTDSFGGMPALFYSYPNFIASRMMPELKTRSSLLSRPLWIAQYASLTKPWAPRQSELDFPDKRPWKQWEAWQYSGNCGYRVPGVLNDCDRNLIRTDDIKSWFGY